MKAGVEVTVGSVGAPPTGVSVGTGVRVGGSSGVGVAVTTMIMGVGVGPPVGGGAGVAVGEGDTPRVALGVTVGLAVAVGEGEGVSVADGAVSVGACVGDGVTPVRIPASPPDRSIVPPAMIKPKQQMTTRAKPPTASAR